MSEERAQSEFNMAVSYLNRLNALFYIADEAAITLDAYTWYHTLMALTRELSTEMKEKELEEINSQIQEINPLLTNNQQKNLTRGTNEVSAELYHALHELENQIRKILKEAGLQNKMMDEAHAALK